jgi:two-component system OmpR family sensor kinase
MRRLPIRLRLTLAFALAMALVLAGMGVFLHERLRTDLDHTVDDSLQAQAADVETIVGQPGFPPTQPGRTLAQAGESFAQVLDSRGRVLDATPQLRAGAVISGAHLRVALHRPLVVERTSVDGLFGPSRLLAKPVTLRGGGTAVAVVGASLRDRDHALRSLRRLMLIGGPIALVLASLAGYAVAAAALRPVESMRRRAAEISAGAPGRRLPVSPARDEISRLGTTMNEMLARLEAAFARERTFVSDASHELRTPLAILKTELELALRHERSPEELDAALRSAAEETDRLATLADELLLVARSDQGQLQVRRRELEVAELLAQAASRFEPRAGTEERSIEVRAASGLRLRADPLRLGQALDSLLENTLRYGSGPIVLAGVERDGRVELHVADRGPGFPGEFLPRAFERFSRGAPDRGGGGTGLGLSIVAAIALAHGGSAHAENRSGGGADVWLSLPA